MGATMTNDQALHAVFAWAGQNGVSVCREDWCPRRSGNGGYCLECHDLAYEALSAVRQRFLNAWIGLSLSPVGEAPSSSSDEGRSAG